MHHEGGSNDELILSIKNILKKVEGGIYSEKIKAENTIYDVYFIEETSTLLILLEEENYNYFISYNCIYENASYDKTNENLKGFK